MPALFLLVLLLIDSRAESAKLFADILHVSVVMNPFQPLALYDPPCDFGLFQWGEARPTTCKPGEVVDHFGLCASCEWDCDMGYNYSAPVDYYYENYLPSRAFECQCYCTAFMSKKGRMQRGHGSQQNRSTSGACASTFIVDDELEQTISVLQSVNMQTEHYTAVEVGSRQGVWGLKAAQLARRPGMGFQSVHVQSIEADPKWKLRQALKISMNKLDDIVTMSSGLITKENFPKLIHSLTLRSGNWQPINYMDWDCQGCEHMLASAEAVHLFQENVLMLFIATHGHGSALHVSLSRAYKKYVLIDKFGTNRCDFANKKALWKNRAAQTSDMTSDRAVHCLQESPFGPVYYRDGTLKLFNEVLFKKLELKLRLPNCPVSKNLTGHAMGRAEKGGRIERVDFGRPTAAHTSV